MKCDVCGATSGDRKIINSKKYGIVCDKCYQRERLNPTTYPLPNYGEIAYSPDGKPICHICGKAYSKVLAHVWQVHGLSAYEYKKEFGLATGIGIMSEESKEIARDRNKEYYSVVVEQNLIKGGKDTRFKEGCEGRTADKVSEQTRRQLVKHIRKYIQYK